MEGKLKTHKVYESIIKDHQRKLNLNEKTTESKNIIDSFLLEREKRKSTNDSSAQYYTDEQFNHLLADIFGAGLDTTLTTLRWFLIFMAAYPHEQHKVQEELDAVLNGKEPTLDDMFALPLTQAAIYEAQRIRSVVPVGIPHGTLQNTEIEGKYYTVRPKIIEPHTKRTIQKILGFYHTRFIYFDIPYLGASFRLESELGVEGFLRSQNSKISIGSRLFYYTYANRLDICKFCKI